MERVGRWLAVVGKSIFMDALTTDVVLNNSDPCRFSYFAVCYKVKNGRRI